jgi:hypothetical protein
VLVEINWDLRSAMTLDQALKAVSDLRLVFSRRLDPRPVKIFAPHLVQAWSVPSSAVFGVRPLARQVSLDDTTLVLALQQDQRAFGELTEVGGAIVIDVHCDFLRDEKNQPVSSSLGPLLFGADQPLAPGGLLRLWLRVGR